MQAFFLILASFFVGVAIVRTTVLALAIALSVVIWLKVDDALAFVSTYIANLVDPEVGGYVIRLVDGLAYIGIWDALSSILGAFLIVLTVKMAFRFIGWLLS